MSWDAIHDRDSGRPRRTEDPKVRGSRRPTPSSRPPSGLVSQNPRGRSLRARDRSGAPVPALPAVIEEELWFGGHDPSVAEDAAARSMAALVGRIVGAKPFPESARRLADLTRKDVIRIEPIIQVLERDPALSARLLRLVNSAGYALRQRCTSVRHAATLVGTDRLHQIATTAAVLDLFDAHGSMAARIIEHSTIVGAFCRYFGAHLALPVDDLFTAGFLHDIGKLMLLETEGDQYVELLEKYADQPDAIHLAERSIYGFDHAVLAAHVLNAWNIPDPVPKIVAWHHDPTRAYRISSMMAALVQTVRLADAAVYAMVRGVSQQDFSTLASSESASYLDISEPQLASMWDELQTLYHESIEQCRGENAPALDPRSLRPKQPLSVAVTQDQNRSAELPLQYPCVVCGGPTFGNTCSACGGPMCPEHQVGREDWCTLCARDYHNEESEAPAAMSLRLAVLIGLGTIVISVAIGYESRGAAGGVRAGIGTCMLLALAAVLAVIGRRWLLRFRFVRTRPDRNMVEALENDGGVQSLVPPTMDNSMATGDPHRDSLSEHIRLSGAIVERVVIHDVPSIPAIIAPRPFDGLSGASLMAAPRGEEASLEVPTAPDSARNSCDAERVMMQSMSLVTLPAPAHARGSDQHHDERYRDTASTLPQSQQASPSALDPLASDVSLGRIEPSPIEVPRTDFGPQTPPRDGSRPETRAAAADAGAVSAMETEPQMPAPLASTHPLAALGLHPERPAKRPTLRDTQPGQGPVAEPAQAAPEANAEPKDRAERTTLLGLTAESVQVPEPEQVQEPERVMATAPPTTLELETRGSDATDAASAAEPVAAESTVAPPSRPCPGPTELVVPLAKVLRSEPPAMPMAASANTGFDPKDLLQPVAAAIAPEMLSKLGPEFQARVMELVAERVATAVAEQMLQSFGQAGRSQAQPKPSRAPLAKVGDAEVSGANTVPPKRSRKRASSH
jgi:HD-like signal output (HDOD) protein